MSTNSTDLKIEKKDPKAETKEEVKRKKEAQEATEKTTEIKREFKETKETKEKKEEMKDTKEGKRKKEQSEIKPVEYDFIKFLTPEQWELDIRCCLLLLALREENNDYPFEAELKDLANHSLNKMLILNLLPRLEQVSDFFNNNVSLLDTICAIVISNPLQIQFALTVIQKLIPYHKGDSALTFLNVLNFSYFSNSAVGSKILLSLIPAIKSQHTKIFNALLLEGSSEILIEFMKASTHRDTVYQELTKNYRCGDKSVFHKLCDIQDHKQIEERFKKIVILASKKLEFGKIKTTSCNGLGKPECLNPDCSVTLKNHKQAAPKDVKESKEPKDIKEVKEVKASTESKETKDVNESKTKEIKDSKELQKDLDVDLLNVCDADGRTAIDYLSLWSKKKHVDTITEFGFRNYDDLSCLFRYGIQSLCTKLDKFEIYSKTLFPIRAKEQFKGTYIKHFVYNRPLLNANLLVAALSYFPPSDAAVQTQALIEEDGHTTLGAEPMSYGSLAQCLMNQEPTEFSKLLQDHEQAGYAKRLEAAFKMTNALLKHHDSGIIHGNITPETIYFHEDPNSKVLICKLGNLDFSPNLDLDPNMSRRLNQWSDWTRHHNAIPPELIYTTQNQATNYTKISDVYSLGKVLQILFMHDLLINQNKTTDLKYLLDLATEEDTNKRITAARLSFMLEMIWITQDPNDKTDPKKILGTVTDITGLVFEITKENWSKVFNTFSATSLRVGREVSPSMQVKPTKIKLQITLVQLANRLLATLPHIITCTRIHSLLKEITTKPIALPKERLEIVDPRCDIWEKAARFNGQYKPNSEKKIPVESDISDCGLDETNTTIHFPNLYKHASLALSKEVFKIYRNIIKSHLSGGFFTTENPIERLAESRKRNQEFRTEIENSLSHRSFQFTTRAHAQLIRILARVANFLTANFPSHPDFKQALLQFFDIVDAFELGGAKLFDALVKNVYETVYGNDKEIFFVFKRVRGEQASLRFRRQPNLPDPKTGSMSTAVDSIELTQEEFEIIQEDQLLNDKSIVRSKQ